MTLKIEDIFKSLIFVIIWVKQNTYFCSKGIMGNYKRVLNLLQHPFF